MGRATHPPRSFCLKQVVWEKTKGCTLMRSIQYNKGNVFDRMTLSTVVLASKRMDQGPWP